MTHMLNPINLKIPDDAIFSLSDKNEYCILPGFCDVHVHFREPGFSYKETLLSGSLSAARGGFTAVCTMPNLDPVPDCVSHLAVQTALIEKDARIRVFPYGALTVSEKGESLSEMEALAPFVIAFSDDGKGVQDTSLMREAMERAKAMNKIIAAHCEVDNLLQGGYIHAGNYAVEHGHKGICSESEWKMIERDLLLAQNAGCAYHVCHISCRESVQLIRDAKKSGMDVTCETAPHYLLLDENDLTENGRFKMNPPLRSRADREALLEGLTDGTIDMIATDHAPHSEEEKSKGLEHSAFGVTGLETAFPVLYTDLVKTNILSLKKLIDLMAISPRKRFGIPADPMDFSVWQLNEKYTIDPDAFLSKGRSTPFSGKEVFGKNKLTVCHGMTVYQDK